MGALCIATAPLSDSARSFRGLILSGIHAARDSPAQVALAR